MVGKAFGLSFALVALAAHAGGAAGTHRGTHGMGTYEHLRIPQRTLGSNELQWEERQQVMERILRFEQELEHEHSIARRCQETFPASTKILLQCIKRLAARS